MLGKVGIKEATVFAALHCQDHVVLFNHCLGVCICRQGVGMPLDELAVGLARLFGKVDVEKLDVVSGLVLASAMQVGGGG
jgi:hypothetical protein